ncbi:4Fe-4S binding protein [Fundidesulfovibrio putealis]|uniref:4Fe-4S binding protein n=1 Tax=Fundidesulfovibrio putealis TaxID=270496 RepID=UPI000400CE24|nr:4Fe-4S dicluster domain-containing protein [Fundidesulfovibrio putealis]
MKKAALITVVILGGLIPAAHLHRWQGLPEALAWLAPLALLPLRREFVRRACQALMLAGVLVTLNSMVFFIKMRLAMGMPWTRLAVILAVAAMLPALAAWALERPYFASRPKGGAAPETAGGVGPADVGGTPGEPSGRVSGIGQPEEALSGWRDAPLKPLQITQRPPALARDTTIPALAAWALTLCALGAVQLKASTPMLLAERFLPGAGWLEASLLALYAGFVVQAMLSPGRSPVVRRRIWGLFSFVFFAQLALGLVGFERFLMTGALHLPVPALIAAGPLFRGEGLFMLILFGSTVLLLGPGWCSHLCYIGAWDSAMSGAKKRPGPLPAWVRRGRAALAVLVLGGAWLMGRLGVPVVWAAGLAAGFGLAGVGIMIIVSRRAGVMTHCTGWCPMGLAAGILGKLSPWRLRIREGCTSCGACSMACRYDALRPEDLAARRPGVSCSLCGDCLERCPRGEMSLTVFGRGGPGARAAFVTLAVSLHALFLGVARL